MTSALGRVFSRGRRLVAVRGVVLRVGEPDDVRKPARQHRREEANERLAEIILAAQRAFMVEE